MENKFSKKKNIRDTAVETKPPLENIVNFKVRIDFITVVILLYNYLCAKMEKYSKMSLKIIRHLLFSTRREMTVDANLYFHILHSFHLN